VPSDPERIAADLRTAFEFADLLPPDLDLSR
jgi:hypothetical protein